MNSGDDVKEEVVVQEREQDQAREEPEVEKSLEKQD